MDAAYIPENAVLTDGPTLVIHAAALQLAAAFFYHAVLYQAGMAIYMRYVSRQ
jgi:hypothetical protein